MQRRVGACQVNGMFAGVRRGKPRVCPRCSLANANLVGAHLGHDQGSPVQIYWAQRTVSTCTGANHMQRGGYLTEVNQHRSRCFL